MQALTRELDSGEVEVLVLAIESQADQILMDERLGRLMASRMDLSCIGILGILVEAKSQGLVAKVKPLLD